MKIRSFLIAGCIFFLAVAFISSCFSFHDFDDDDVSISIRESDDEYRLSALFDKSKTRRVQNYIGEYTGHNSLFRSGNVQIDGTTSLNEDGSFYIKFHPGRLKIKFNKEENSEESCDQIREMCEGIKELLEE